MSQDQVEEDRCAALEEQLRESEMLRGMMCRVCPVGAERDRAYARIADLEAEVRTAEARAAEHKSACDAALVRLQDSDLKRALAEADAVDVRTRLGAAQADLDAMLLATLPMGALRVGRPHSAAARTARRRPRRRS